MRKLTKRKIDLTTGNILLKLLIVALPTLLTSLVQMTYNLTDMFWVGRVDSIGLSPTEAIAAVGTVGYYPWFGFGLILLAKIGTSVKISQMAGKNDVDGVRQAGNTGFILILLFSLVYMSFGLFFSDFYIGIFNLDNANVVAYAKDYMQVIAMFGFAFFIVNLFNGVYDGLGKTINTLLVTGSGLVLNIILDPFFILEDFMLFGLSFNGLGMGVKGAAIATVISQSFILLIYIIIYVSPYRPFTLRPLKYFSKQMFRKIVRIGTPVGVQSMLFTSISIVIGVMVASYGEEVMATQRLGSQIEAVAWMIASGFQVALASFVGQNFGAMQYQRIKDGFKVALKLLIPYGIIVNIGMFVFAEDVFSVFISTPETLKIGVLYLQILSISQLFMIIELGVAGAFNGLGKTMVPSGVGIVGNFLRIPGAALLSIPLGFAGIWWAVSGSSILKGMILVIWFIILLRKLGEPNGILFENSN
ncbi:MAG: MATE family efflux transporter [Candidatus Izimaplasma sp.]|nr:MATE family efflux transporter [Candidatus Izimaplasma bacterium]